MMIYRDQITAVMLFRDNSFITQQTNEQLLVRREQVTSAKKAGSRPHCGRRSGFDENKSASFPSARLFAPTLSEAQEGHSYHPDMNYGYGAPPGGHPGAYPGGFPGQQQDPLFGYFTAVAGQDGQISSEELQACLTQANFSGGYKPFNLETCRLMISMLDRDMSGSMGFNEFKELWAVINGWKQHFMSIDKDMSGTVDPQEMTQAISSMGYRLSPQAMNCIIKRYSTQGKITFDDYVACCVRLRTLTDIFRRRDQAQQGVATFQYDDFIQCTLST